MIGIYFSSCLDYLSDKGEIQEKCTMVLIMKKRFS